jgi:glycosyltransferase involved in cell wall biosynthesis
LSDPAGVIDARVCLIVPAGTFDASPLVANLIARHPSLEVSAVWAGDPHLRPAEAAPGVRWADLDLEESVGIGWGRLLAGIAPQVYEWARAARAVARMLRERDEPVVVLRVGSVGVVGSIDDLVPRDGIKVLVRTRGRFPADGLAPGVGDLTERGRWSSAILGFAPASLDAVDDLAATLAFSRPDDRVGPLIELSLSGSEVPIEALEHGVVVGWSTESSSAPPVVVDVDDIDRSEPWHLAFGGRRPRVLLSEDPDIAHAVMTTIAQWSGVRSVVSLPGGIEIDTPIRTLVSEAIAAWARGEDDLPPDPFSGSGLLEWLEAPSQRSGWEFGRYWYEEWVRRPDLHAAFPRPIGEDRDRFATWARQSWRSDGRSPLIKARTGQSVSPWFDVDRHPGVNLVGYVASDSGLGDFTRRLYSSLDAAQVPTSALHYHRTASPIAHDLPPLTSELSYDTNLITVHVDQMNQLDADHGAQLFRDRASIGFWFWELSHLPARIVANVAMVDEVWAATEFIADAFRGVTDKPVHVVHVPVPEPVAGSRSRAELGLEPDRFVFLVTLDHLSITDRKNPLGAIHAFERAFPTASDDGPMLVVKTLNARQRWSEHEQLQVAAAGRPDIEVVDRHMTRTDQMSLIAHSDCLISLHRSEGLGLHLMEAMWLGTPVIATRYSGNLEFMNAHNSALVDAELVPVSDRQGYYPTEAVWADPDLDQAAESIRRMVEDHEYRSGLASAGRRSMMEQSSPADAGRVIAELCRQAGQNQRRA